jgi:hypothetical protein
MAGCGDPDFLRVLLLFGAAGAVELVTGSGIYLKINNLADD